MSHKSLIRSENPLTWGFSHRIKMGSIFACQSGVKITQARYKTYRDQLQTTQIPIIVDGVECVAKGDGIGLDQIAFMDKCSHHSQMCNRYASFYNIVSLLFICLAAGSGAASGVVSLYDYTSSICLGIASAFITLVYEFGKFGQQSENYANLALEFEALRYQELSAKTRAHFDALLSRATNKVRASQL